MGRPPAYIFIVRHGYRLDAADKQWHLTSPTPYDPPLTYGGWKQAQALGARIGSILRERILEDEAAQSAQSAQSAQEQHGTPKPRRKRFKVVIHSSPFLRCIQTSIGVSAGVAQDDSPLAFSSGSDAATSEATRRQTTRIEPTRRAVLRLDAFLGEWLTPKYYEHITAPPQSVMMLASAKADLLRRETCASHLNLPTRANSSLWSSTTAAPNGLENLSGLAESLPGTKGNGAPGSPAGYVAPVPNYAISSGGNIPPGFVAHARDACVEMDFQWDSMRGPQEWGDGGEYGEEWTAMHRRFRQGIQRLVDWYSSEDAPTDMVTKSAARWATNGEPDESVDEAEDVETEAVVILVSHGAGCNALIGAVTHQPALEDVAMASLTMAVRRRDVETHVDGGKTDSSWLGDAKQIAVHELYDLTIRADTDHLRSSTLSTPATRTPSVAGTRGRFMSSSFSSPSSNFSLGDGWGSRSFSASAAAGSSRRTSGPSRLMLGTMGSAGAGTGTGTGITVGSGMTSFGVKSSNLARSPSFGLWSPVAPRDDDEVEDDGLMLNFGHEKTDAKPVRDAMPGAGAGAGAVASAAKSAGGVNGSADSLGLGVGLGGLWGSGGAPQPQTPATAPATAGEFGSAKQRRWTVNERA